MIGSRSLPATAMTGVALVLALGGGAPRPELGIAARAAVIERAGAAEGALDVLRERLAAALDAARAGSARIVAGDAAPGPMLDRAADGALAAVDLAAAAAAARAGLAGARDVLSPGAPALPPAPSSAELASVGAQLRATADAAEAFVVMRGRAESVTPGLLEALDALESGTLDEADRRASEARATLDALAAWEIGAETLPVWIETVDEMIGAMERLVTATRAGDAAAAEAAAAEFAALAEDAPGADRALRIAVGEGGTAVAAPALERLAQLLAAADELRMAVVTTRRAAGG